MELKIKATDLMVKNLNSQMRITINEGSSRSGKTYNIMIMFVLIMLQEKCLITVVRKTRPAVKSTAYKDFLDIVRGTNLYHPKKHNQTELTYKLGLGEIEFISVDDHDKVRGRKRDYLFCNEANELSRDEFTQLAIRTVKNIWIDYNPSHSSYHWLEKDIKTRDDVVIFHSTYKDNPFLELAVIKEIERLKDLDENLWRIYGLGLRGVSKARVYSDWELVDNMPENYDNEFFGLDFGYNNQSALVHIRERDDEYYYRELLYVRHTTIPDLIKLMNNLPEKEILKNRHIYADGSIPAYLVQIMEAGFSCYKADKEAGSVKAGIDLLKSKKNYITKDSLNLIKENRAYSYPVDKNGEPDERDPVKAFDHLLDAIRYAVTSFKKKKIIGFLN